MGKTGNRMSHPSTRIIDNSQGLMGKNTSGLKKCIYSIL